MRRAWMVALVLGTACGSGDAEPGGPAGEVKAPRATQPSPLEPSKAEPTAPPLEPALIEPLGEPKPSDEAMGRGPVELPAAPSLAAPAVPERYPDGTWSIAGLRRDPEAHIAEGEGGAELMIRAYVQEIYVPPPCADPRSDSCPPAQQPHLWASDTADARGHARSLLVVDYQFSIPEWQAAQWKGVEPLVLEVGQQYTLKGKFLQHSDSGFAHPEGLLALVAVQRTDPKTGTPRWVAPPGAPWHPLELARQEEENARLAEKARAGK